MPDPNARLAELVAELATLEHELIGLRRVGRYGPIGVVYANTYRRTREIRDLLREAGIEKGKEG